MNQTEEIKQDCKTENNTDNRSAPSYRVKINDTDVVIRFTGSDSLNSRLASAFSAML